MSKTILVTGGAGYIGSVLVRELLRKGYKVRVFDKLVFGDFALQEVLDKIELIKGDIKEKLPDNLFNNIDGVIHLAGLSTEPTSNVDPRETDLVNHIATEQLAVLAKSKGVKRFVYASSASVYFTYDTPLEPPLYKEDDIVNSISPYSISKRSSEIALLGLADANFEPVILRKGTLYGFSPKMRYDLVMNSFVKDAFVRKEMTIHANGEIYRPMLSIDGAVDAYIQSLELPTEKVVGKIFNISDTNWKITDLANKVKAVLKSEKNIDVDINIQSTGIARNYLIDNSKYKEIFNYHGRKIEDAILEIWQKLEAGHDYNDERFYTDLWIKKSTK